MLSNNQQKAKASLTDIIDEWLASSDRDSFDSYASPLLAELMAEAAFAVIMAQEDLTRFYKQEQMLK